MITQVEIGAELRRRTAEAEAAVRKTVHRSLSQAQFDSLVSFVYNTGPTISGPLLSVANNGEHQHVAALLKTFIRARLRDQRTGHERLVILPGLVRRRAEEAAAFETGSNQ